MEFKDIEKVISADAAKVTAVVKAVELLQHYASFKSLDDVKSAIKELQAIVDAEEPAATTEAVKTETVSEAPKA